MDYEIEDLHVSIKKTLSQRVFALEEALGERNRAKNKQIKHFYCLPVGNRQC